MRARSISTIAVAFVTLAVVFLVGTLTTEAAGQKKGSKGKSTPIPGRAIFRTADPENISLDAHIQNDVFFEYVDERAGGGIGVEETLGSTKYGLGNLQLRLEESFDPERTVTLDFSNPVLEADGVTHKGCLFDDGSEPNPHFLELGKSNQFVTVSVHYLSAGNIGLTKGDEAVIIEYECGNLDCIEPGETRAGSLTLNWISLDPLLPNTRVAVRFRNNASINNRLAPHYVRVTRCITPTEQNPGPSECSEINLDLPGSIPETTWIISTRSGSPDGLFTGPQACVLGHSLKGKKKRTNYGLFYMPVDLVISCATETDCSLSGA